MAVVSLLNGFDWLVARWVYRALLAEAARDFEEDSDFQYAVNQAIALDGLHLDLEEPQTAQRLLSALSSAASRIVDGSGSPAAVEGRVLDPISQDQYRKAARELLAGISGSS
jgi:hypothetical protein